MSKISNNQLSIINRRGVALLTVLFIIMAITVLSLGFLARSSTELSLGRNSAARAEMDQLAASGLEHARGLILNPQETASDWTGATGQQLSSDPYDANYYDVTVTADPNDTCNYTIESEAYRLNSQGQKTTRSILSAQLRLDPAIALWTGADTTLTSELTIHGDIYCGGTLTNNGAIAVNGDAFAGGTITGDFVGRENESVTQATVEWPFGNDTATTVINSFKSHYPSWQPVPSGTCSSDLGTPGSTSLFYYDGDLAISDGVTVNGMLLVKGNLRIVGNNVAIRALKNLPAFYVTGDLVVGNVSGIQIEGLAVVRGKVLLGADVTDMSIRGALFVQSSEKPIAEIVTADSSGKGNYGRVYGEAAWLPSGGVIGGALRFDGVDDYVQTSDSSSTLQLVNNYTLSLWMNADAVQNASAGILSKCSPDGSTNYWTLQFDDSAQEIIVRHPRISLFPSSWFTWSTGIRVSQLVGGWHHVCVVYDTHAMRAYLDGDPCDSGPLWFGPQSGDGHLNIGTDRTAQHLYKGLLDSIHVYSRALSDEEVAALAAGSSVSSSNLLGYWEFDENGTDCPHAAITVDPAKASIITWTGGIPQHWSPAAGAFFKRVSRVTP
jgi:Tfp pilus assembly protein PilX